ncbi:MAG: ATPase, T2SS/T4P/T4SS family [Microthrixaceae bacterium]
MPTYRRDPIEDPESTGSPKPAQRMGAFAPPPVGGAVPDGGAPPEGVAGQAPASMSSNGAFSPPPVAPARPTGDGTPGEGLVDPLTPSAGNDPFSAPPASRDGAGGGHAATGTGQGAPASNGGGVNDGSPGNSRPDTANRTAQQSARAAQTSKSDSVAADLRHRIHEQLIEELGPILFDSRLSEEDLRRKVNDQLHAAIAAERVPLSAADKAALIQAVADDILGYGPIDRLLKEEAVTEIMVNGPDMTFVERNGKLTLDETVRFIDYDHVRRVIDKIVSAIGRRVDESTPMVDARLPDGSRVNAVIAPLAIGGPFLTIRKFATDPLRIDDLIRFGSINAHAARFLQACIVGKLNVIVSGGTGTGKTTMLNVLSGFIPTDERIVTVEDAKELQLHQDHVLSLESRPPNVEGRGEVSIRDLVKNTLRMRPDRIVVGECRSGEALDMLQAMNTGHDGSLTTVHANSPRDSLARLETLVLMAGFDLPVRAIREQMASAVDVIVQLSRLRDGTRRVTHVTEVQGMEGDVITLQDVFLFDFGAGVDESGRFRGQLQATGVRPKFASKLADLGIRLGPEMFAPGASA